MNHFQPNPSYDFDPPIEFVEGYNSQVRDIARAANPYGLGRDPARAEHWDAGWDKAFQDWLDTLTDED